MTHRRTTRHAHSHRRRRRRPALPISRRRADRIARWRRRLAAGLQPVVVRLNLYTLPSGVAGQWKGRIRFARRPSRAVREALDRQAQERVAA